MLQVPELDVFDGIIFKTVDGLRFADANVVAYPSEYAGGSLHDWFGRAYGRGDWKQDDQPRGPEPGHRSDAAAGLSIAFVSRGTGQSLHGRRRALLEVGVFWGSWSSLSRPSAETTVAVGHEVIPEPGVPMAFLLPFALLNTLATPASPRGTTRDG